MKSYLFYFLNNRKISQNPIMSLKLPKTFTIPLKSFHSMDTSTNSMCLKTNARTKMS